MDKVELIDEIDWLIFELTPGTELQECHQCSLEAIGIECRHKRLSRASSSTLIEMLKAKREKLI